MATLITSVPFDLQRDLAPVSGLTDNSMVLVAHPSVPAKTVAELIARAKAKPGTSKYPPAEPGALSCEPLEAAVGAADAAPDCVGHL